MGLDMYLEGRKSLFDEPGQESPKEDGFRVKGKTIALGYWRKHPNLHGYIVETFAEGKDECQDIHLESADLKNIIQAIKDKRLPETQGFFFGTSDGSEDEESIKILEGALNWLEQDPSLDPTKGSPRGIPFECRDVVYRASW